jgi:hypothetical protein
VNTARQKMEVYQDWRGRTNNTEMFSTPCILDSLIVNCGMLYICMCLVVCFPVKSGKLQTSSSPRAGSNTSIQFLLKKQTKKLWITRFLGVTIHKTDEYSSMVAIGLRLIMCTFEIKLVVFQKLPHSHLWWIVFTS